MRLVPRIALALFLLAESSRAAPPIFPLRDVKPGLRGECHTVFSGTRVQAFPFEVMGVAKDFAGPGRDIIWCKMLDDPTKQMVVAGGMSGSPCFVQDRNMGALAYGWMFNKDPIFGVQPIESMLELFEFRGNARDVRGWRSLFGGGLSPARSSPGARMISTLAGFALPPGQALSEPTASPIPLPLEIGGLHPLAREPVARALQEAGFFPIFGGGGASQGGLGDASDLVPGSPLTGLIARGDLSMAATGTLTWRDGDRVLAFGHPFLGAGAIAIPMGKAEIIGIVSSYMRSFKMANKGPVIGTLTQDRMSAVAGFIGRVPRMVPMTVKVAREGAPLRTHRLEFCDNKFFTLSVYQTALLQFLANVMERSEEGTLAIRSEVRIKGAPPLVFEDMFAGEKDSWALDSVVGPATQLGGLYANDFALPEIESVAVEASFRPTVHQLSIEQLSAEPREARPGDVVRLRAAFQPWHGKRINREFETRIPEEAKSGEVQVVLADAARASQLDGRSASRSSAFLVASGAEPSDAARSLDETVIGLNDRRPSDRLYLLITRAAEGLNLGERHLPALPESVRKLIASDSTAGSPSHLSTLILSETQVPMQARIEGSRSITIRIK